ncbi:hypothetical protein Bbelb_212920 [Branchiostoma belcheri]|nr:hypothetical protein Bbelb_212920 [Branchiostoma belcheri]
MRLLPRSNLPLPPADSRLHPRLRTTRLCPAAILHPRPRTTLELLPAFSSIPPLDLAPVCFHSGADAQWGEAAAFRMGRAGDCGQRQGLTNSATATPYYSATMR